MVSKKIVQGEKDIEIALNQISEQLLGRHLIWGRPWKSPDGILFMWNSRSWQVLIKS
jgi:hypothetical protein